MEKWKLCKLMCYPGMCRTTWMHTGDNIAHDSYGRYCTHCVIMYWISLHNVYIAGDIRGCAPDPNVNRTVVFYSRILLYLRRDPVTLISRQSNLVSKVVQFVKGGIFLKESRSEKTEKLGRYKDFRKDGSRQ